MAAIYQLKIKYDLDKFGVFSLDAKRPVNFPLEDQHTVNEHHVARKSYDATQKQIPHVVHSKYHVIGLKQTRGIKNVQISFLSASVHHFEWRIGLWNEVGV